MPIPESPRFGDLLQRLLLTKGYASANVLEDYFPTIDMLSGKPELFKLRDERTFIAGGNGLGAVGLGGRVWCMNKTARQLVTVDRVFISTAVAGVLFIDVTTVGLPADGAGGQSVAHSNDTRYGTGVPGTTPPAPVGVANDTAGVTSGVPFTRIGAASGGASSHQEMRYVLRPGYAVVVSFSAQGAGSDFTCCFQGYARGAENSELF